VNKQLKAEWVKALRSGEYKQGRLRLQRGDSYCCLGVLCEVAGVAIPRNGIDLDCLSLRKFGDECGLLTKTSHISLQGRLIQLNDSDLLPFPAIADWIEANVPEDEA